MKDFKIQSLKAKEIIDSNKKPTLAVELKTNWGKFVSSVPSGVSTGEYEAVELRDADGRGAKGAADNVKKIIAPVLEKEFPDDQRQLDRFLIRLDGTKNKSKFGANAILAVSLACCRAISAAKGLPLYGYISQLSDNKPRMPKPSFNMIEGGKHARNGLAFQEFMVVPQGANFKENLETGRKIYEDLGGILKKKFGKIPLSAEGAFAPSSLGDAAEALDLILEAVGENNVKIAVDAAASEFYQGGNYQIGGRSLTSLQLSDYYHRLTEKYPLISIEDPFSQEDYGAWASFSQNDLLVIGDDLTVTNLDRIKMAHEQNLCNGIIIKPNQIGTVSETIEAVQLARSYGWKIMVSNRGGETEDDFIADLAVGVGSDFIKSGAPFPKERMAKYNRLSKIEEELSSNLKKLFNG